MTSATGPFATILSERAPLVLVAEAVDEVPVVEVPVVVVDSEPVDVGGEIILEPVAVPDVVESIEKGSGETLELEVMEAGADVVEVVEVVESGFGKVSEPVVIGPGPSGDLEPELEVSCARTLLAITDSMMKT